MKAKEYYNIIADTKNEKEFFDKLNECVLALIDEANNLIKSRNAKTREAQAACINEINNKWLSICYTHEKRVDSYEIDSHLRSIKILRDGFKAAYITKHPDKEWYFTKMKDHLEYIEKNNEEANKKLKDNELFLHQVIPYNELTMENITSEILSCMMSLGSAASHGIPIQWVKPLADRITLLRYWKDKGSINLSDVEEMEKNPIEFFRSRNYI